MDLGRNKNALQVLTSASIPHAFETLQSKDIWEVVVAGIKARVSYVIVDHVCPYNQALLKKNGFGLYTYVQKVVIVLDDNAFNASAFYKTSTLVLL
jgi:hypothetical protein